MSAKRVLPIIVLMLALASCVPPVGPPPRPTPKPPADAVAATDAILVQYEPGSSREQRAFAGDIANAETVHVFDLVPGLEKLAVTDVDAALKSLSRLPYVVYAEPDYLLVPTDTTPNDPMFDRLWGMVNILAPAAWDVTTGQPEVVVAVIDSGIDYNHVDLAANIWTNPGETPGNGLDDDGNGYVDDIRGWDFYERDSDPLPDFFHGTHIAGTVGAVGNNQLGVAGVAWQVKLMPLRFMTARGGFTSDAIRALEYAVANGARISTHSYGNTVRSSSFNNAARAAGRRGHLLVAAAGNGGSDNDVSPLYPASYNLDNILAVAALDPTDNLATFSNYGVTSVDLAAPGVGILSTTLGNQFQNASGTSMAVPHVAGVAALVAGLHPDWGPAQIRNQILATTRGVPSLAGRVATGGVLNAFAAVSQSAPGPTPTPALPPTPVPPTPLPQFISLALNETTILGHSKGRLSDTYARDNRFQIISERKSTGKPDARYDALEHVWEFYVPSRPVSVFRANVWRTPSTDNDTLVFEFSTDRVNYTEMFAVAALGPTSSYQEFTLPASLADDLVYIRVRDTNRTSTLPKAEDSVTVDHMEIISTD